MKRAGLGIHRTICLAQAAGKDVGSRLPRRVGASGRWLGLSEDFGWAGAGLPNYGGFFRLTNRLQTLKTLCLRGFLSPEYPGALTIGGF